MRRRWGVAFRVPKGLGVMLLWGAALVAAAVYAWAMTPWGPWAFSDSVAYMDGARNLFQGVGLYAHTSKGGLEFLTHFPPGYPGALALGLWLTQGDWLAAARWVNLVSLVLFLVVAGGVMYRATRIWAAGLLTMVALAGFLPITHAYLGMMSEGLFMAVQVVSLYLLWRYVSLGEKRWLWAAAWVAGLAVLVRYVGLALGIVFFFAPWLFSPESSRWRRWKDGLVAALITATPFLLWTGYSFFFGHLAPRTLSPPNQWQARGWGFVEDTARSFLDVVGLWKGGPLPLAGVVGVWAVLLALGVWGVYRWRGRRWVWADAEALFLVAWLYTMVWFPALGLMHVLVNPVPEVSVRMYTPAMASAVVMLVAAMWAVLWSRWPDSGFWQEVGALLVVGVLAAALWKMPHLPTRLVLWDMHGFGKGYTDKRWHEMASSGVLHFAQQFPSDALFFSNRWEAVLLWTGRPVHLVSASQWSREEAWGNGPAGAWRREGGPLVLIRLGEDEEALQALLLRLQEHGAVLCAQGPYGWVYLPAPPLPDFCSPKP